jgi:hypothetical protein
VPSTDSWAALPRHSARCICRRCRDARRRSEYEGWRAYGPAVERVYSDEASAHIHQLVRLGWKQTEIAAAAGVAPSTVSTAKERGCSSTPRPPSASWRCSRGSPGGEDRGHRRTDAHLSVGSSAGGGCSR